MSSSDDVPGGQREHLPALREVIHRAICDRHNPTAVGWRASDGDEMKTKLVYIAITAVIFVLLLCATIDAATYAGDGSAVWRFECARVSIRRTPAEDTPRKSVVFFSALPGPCISTILTPRFELHEQP